MNRPNQSLERTQNAFGVTQLVLVRRMQPRLILAALVGMAITSCTSIPVVYNEPGQNYTLSREDVAEINRLIAHRRDIRKPLGVAWMKANDRVEIDSGNVSEPFGEITRFTIRKKNGRWIIDESSVRQDYAIVTS